MNTLAFPQPFVYRPDGSHTRVRTLGWLLRHASDVERITCLAEAGRYWDVTMIAYLKDGRSFTCMWADRKVCRAWLKRPRFKGKPLYWLKYETTC